MYPIVCRITLCEYPNFWQTKLKWFPKLKSLTLLGFYFNLKKTNLMVVSKLQANSLERVSKHKAY